MHEDEPFSVSGGRRKQNLAPAEGAQQAPPSQRANMPNAGGTSVFLIQRGQLLRGYLKNIVFLSFKPV